MNLLVSINVTLPLITHFTHVLFLFLPAFQLSSVSLHHVPTNHCTIALLAHATVITFVKPSNHVAVIDNVLRQFLPDVATPV